MRFEGGNEGAIGGLDFRNALCSGGGDGEAVAWHDGD